MRLQNIWAQRPQREEPFSVEKVKRYLFVILLMALFVEILIIFPKKIEQQEKSFFDQTSVIEDRKNETIGENQIYTEQSMKGVHFVESHLGKRDWEIFADQASGDEKTNQWTLKKLKIIFYNGLIPDYTVIGDQGFIDGKNRDLRVIGQVQTISNNNYVLSTNAIHYSAQTRMMTSEGSVKINGPRDADGEGFQFYGVDLLIDVTKAQIKIQKQVIAQRELKGGVPLEVASDQVELNNKNKEALFSGDVEIKYDQFSMTSPSAKFNYQGTNQLTNLNLSGGVKVVDFNRTATSDLLQLDLLKQKFVFQGHPKVIEGEDILSGEQIEFIDGGKKVRVEKVKLQADKVIK